MLCDDVRGEGWNTVDQELVLIACRSFITTSQDSFVFSHAYIWTYLYTKELSLKLILGPYFISNFGKCLLALGLEIFQKFQSL